MLPVLHHVVRSRLRLPPMPGNRSYVHPHHVLALHLRAQGSMTYGTEQLVAVPPYLALLAAGERDQNSFVGRFEGLWCIFDRDGVRSDRGRQIEITMAQMRGSFSHVRQLPPRAASTALLHFRELLTQSRGPTLGSRLASAGLLLELIGMWVDPWDTAEQPSSPVKSYRRLIDSQATRSDVSLQAMASQVGYSVSHLGMAFRRDYGISPVAYRNHVRLVHARDLLMTSDRSIAEIAAEVGLPDANYFARQFRRAFGVSPRAFVREQVLRQMNQ